MRKLKKNNIIFSFFILLLSCVGFASWVTGGAILGTGISINFGTLLYKDFGNSLVYIIGSEKVPTFYEINDSQTGENLTLVGEENFSIDLKINPVYVEQMFSDDESKIFNIGISYESLSDINYFSENYLCVNEICTLSLLIENSIQIHSSVLFNTVQEGNVFKHSVSSNFYLYNSTDRSIYSIAKKYQKQEEYIYFKIIFNTNVSMTSYSNFKNISFKFFTNLRGSTL